MKRLITTTLLVCGMAFSCFGGRNGSILPRNEMAMVEQVAAEYALTAQETALLCAIRRQENGRPGIEFGVIRPKARRFKDGRRSFMVQARWCAGTIKLRYRGNIAEFGKIWCPTDTKNWVRGVRYFYRRQISK